jgi:hypothetical protein
LAVQNGNVELFHSYQNTKESFWIIVGAHLQEQREAETGDNWYTATIATLRKASPMSLKITLRSVSNTDLLGRNSLSHL